jgi:hypothetical protein
LYEATGDGKYLNGVNQFLDYAIKQAPRTPKGLVRLGDWGSLR